MTRFGIGNSLRLLGILIAVCFVLSTASPSKAQSWSLLAPTGPLPVPRDSAAAVYSSASNRLIVFGGYPHVTTYTNDLWILSDANGLGTPTWTQVIPNGASGSPQARAGAVMVYDSQNNRAILAGGESALPSLANLNDLWVLSNADGTTGTPTWTQLLPQGSFPGRENAGAVYDTQSNRLIVFMGIHPGGLCRPTPCIVDPADVWVLTNANGLGGTPVWSQLPTTGAPPGRILGSVDQTYDAVNNRLIVFGGLRPADQQILNDVWVLTNANGLGDGSSTWTQLLPTGPVPAIRAANTAFYDVQTNRLVIFGGSNDGIGGPTTYFSDLWALDNANGLGGTPAWEQINPSGLAITPHGGSGGVYDSARNRMILFGGNVNGFVTNETWVLSTANGIPTSQFETDAVQPSHGGQGMVTVQVIGGGFQPRAAVKLTGLSADIVGSNTIVSNPSAITTTFDLTGAAVGSRDLVVTNPDGTSATLTDGFTVVQGGTSQILVQIIGPTKIRFDQEQTFFLNLTNTGSVDSQPGLVSLAVPPGVSFHQLNGANLFVAGSTPNPEFAVPSAGTSNVSTLLFATASVPADASVVAPIRLTLPTAGPITNFTLTGGWQNDLDDLNLDDFLGLEGIPFIPFPSGGCSTCLSQYNAELLAHSDILSSYIAFLTAKNNLDTAYSQLPAALGETAGTTLLVATVGLPSLGGVALSVMVGEMNLCAQNLFSDVTSGNQSCLIDLQGQLVTTVSAAADLLKSNSTGLSILQFSTLTTFVALVDNLLSVMKATGNIFEAYGAEQAALGAFQQSLGPYRAARTAYQTCLSPTSCMMPTMPSPPTPPGSSLPVSGVGSVDPNDKIGLQGAGLQRFVSGSAPLSYSIYFANEVTATAPAQQVVITDHVDLAQGDLSTLRLGPITFGSQFVSPPTPGQTSFSTTIDLRPANNLLVAISARLDVPSSLLRWSFQSLDPVTGLPPTDPTAGFLPPGVGGSTFFTISPKQGLPTNSQIQNQATIIFDSNPPISTPTWLNTLDTTIPSSHVLALSPIQTSPNFTFQWTGTDVGAGILDFSIYASDNGGPFALIRSNTTVTSSLFAGQDGHTYSFHSIARDRAGNVEAAKTTAETTAHVTVPPAVQTLTVASTNPAAGIAMTVSPIDNNSQTDGLTQFTRSYNNGTTVTLTAPSTPTGSTFSSWAGCDGTSANMCVVTMTTDRTVTANYTVNNPLPTISSLVQPSAIAGGTAFTLTVNGTGFANGATVKFNANAKTTTFVSATQLTAAIMATDIATAGIIPVTVTNPAPGGGSSTATNFTVNNPAPTISSLVQPNAIVGGPAFTLTMNGSGFVTTSVINFNGSARTTTFVNSTQLTAAISAADIATTGTFPITVTNPAPGGGTSPATNFTVNNPASTISSLSPTSAIAGSAAFTLTVNGTGFVSGATVKFNASTKTTTFVNATQITAPITSPDISTAGTFLVTVTNPAPGGGTSTGNNFAVEDFSISGPPNPVAVSAGQSAQFSINVPPATVSGFPNQVTLSASGLPVNSTASFSQNPVTPGNTTTAVTLTITTTARGLIPSTQRHPLGPVGFPLLLVIVAMLFTWTARASFDKRITFSRSTSVIPIAMFVASVAIVSGCGSALNGVPSNQGTPAGTSQITVTATSGSLSHSTTVTLTVD